MNDNYLLSYQEELVRYYADRLVSNKSSITELSQMLEKESRRYSQALNDENDATTR